MYQVVPLRRADLDRLLRHLPERRADLEGVQCEGCHGPMGDSFPSHKPIISFSTRFEGEGEFRTSTSMCWPCHETQLEEWDTSGHAFFGEGTRLTIEEFNEYFGSDFSHEEFDTIGGLVVNAFGHLPKRGERVQVALPLVEGDDQGRTPARAAKWMIASGLRSAAILAISG